MSVTGDKKKSQDAKSKVEMMVRLLRENKDLSQHTVLDLLSGDNPLQYKLSNGNDNTTIVYGRNGKPIKAKTKNQKKLVDLVDKNDRCICFSNGGG